MLIAWRLARARTWLAALAALVAATRAPVACAGPPATLRVVHALPGLGGDALSVAGTRVYVRGAAGLAIHEFSDASNPIPLGSVALPWASGWQSVHMAASESLVALQDWTDPGDMKVRLIDTSTAASPTLAGVIARRPYTLTLDGHYLYLTAFSSPSFAIYDVSDPQAPRLVFSETTRTLPLENGEPSTVTRPAHGVAIRDSRAFVRFGWTNWPGDAGPVDIPLLVVWDVTNPETPVEIATAPVTTQPWGEYRQGVECTGDALLFTRWFSALSPDWPPLPTGDFVGTMDVSDPAHPRFGADLAVPVGSINDWDEILAMTSDRSGAGLLVFSNGVVQLDLTQPSAPRVRAVHETPTTDAAIQGQHVLLLKPDSMLVLRRAAVGDELGIDAVTPPWVNVGGNVTLDIAGNGFRAGATATLDSGAASVVASQVTVADGANLTATFDLTNAVPGPGTLNVTNPGGDRDGFPVTLTGEPPLWLASVTPQQVPAWGEATLTLQGSGLQPGMEVRLTRGRWPALTASSVTVDPSGESATAVFHLTGVLPATRTLVATNPGTSREQVPNAVDITSVLRIDQVAPTLAAPGQVQLTLTGTGLLPTDELRLTRPWRNPILGTGVSANAEGTTASATFATTEADAGYWDLELRRASSESTVVRRAHGVVGEGADRVSAWPSSVSGLTSQATFQVISGAVSLGAQPVLVHAGGEVLPSGIASAGQGSVLATFLMAGTIPLGRAWIELRGGGLPATPASGIAVDAGISWAGLGDGDEIVIRGLGFVEGCAAWFVDADTGLRVDAQSITLRSSYELSALMPSGWRSTGGAWTAHLQGPNGRVLTWRPDRDREGTRSALVLTGPALSHVSAATGGLGQQITLGIFGRDFGPAEAVRLEGPGTTVHGTDLSHATGGQWDEAWARFDLEGALEGTYSVVVDKAGGPSYRLRDAFGIVPVHHDVQFSVVAPALYRVGSDAALTLRVENNGNADARGYILFGGVPADADWSFPGFENVDGFVVEHEILPDALGSLQTGEMVVPASGSLDVSLRIRMFREARLEWQAHWVGVSRDQEARP